MKKLKNLPKILQSEISKRQRTFNEYISTLNEYNSLKEGNFEHISFLCNAFEQLPYIIKLEQYNSLMESLEKHNCLNEITKKNYPLTYAYRMDYELKKLIKVSDNPVELYKKANDLLLLYNRSDKEQRYRCMQTTASLAYEKAYQIYLDKQEIANARAVLQLAISNIIIDGKNPLDDFKPFTTKSCIL